MGYKAAAFRGFRGEAKRLAKGADPIKRLQEEIERGEDMGTIRPKKGAKVVFTCWIVTHGEKPPAVSEWTGVVLAATGSGGCLVRREYDGHIQHMQARDLSYLQL